MAQRATPEEPFQRLTSPRASSSGHEEPIEKIIERLHAVGFTQIRLDTDSTPPPPARRGCEACGFTGFVVPEWTLEDRTSGRVEAPAVPCKVCLAPELRQRKLSMIFGDSGAPAEYERTTFDSYERLPIHDATYRLPDDTVVEGTQPAALERARAFAAADHGTILFYGSQFGVGKTALAQCCAREIVMRTGCSFVFITTIRLLDRIRSTYGSQSPLRTDEVLNAVLNADLLVLDDIGREVRKPGDAGAWVAERLFDIVDWRHTQHLRTIYTSNKTIPELAEHLDGATAWRIKDHCDPNLVKVQGLNLRGLSRAEREEVLA